MEPSVFVRDDHVDQQVWELAHITVYSPSIISGSEGAQELSIAVVDHGG